MVQRKGQTGAMAGHLRMWGRYLQAPIRCYVQAGSGRRVWLVGMVHYGRAGYFSTIKDEIVRLAEAGALVHCEGTGLYRILADPPADLSPVERQILDELVEQSRRSDLALCHGQWVDQATAMGRCDDWIEVDLSILDMIRMQDAAEMLASLQVANAELDFVEASDAGSDRGRLTRFRARQYTKQYRVRFEMSLRLEAMGRRFPGASGHAVRIHRRNEAALAGLDSAGHNTDVVLVWGSAHLPGLEEGLSDRGFQLAGETWYTVARLRSMPAVVAGSLARNVWRLPRLVREVSTGYAQHKAMVDADTLLRHADPPPDADSTAQQVNA
jgi:hypothetical protein